MARCRGKRRTCSSKRCVRDCSTAAVGNGVNLRLAWPDFARIAAGGAGSSIRVLVWRRRPCAPAVIYDHKRFTKARKYRRTAIGVLNSRSRPEREGVTGQRRDEYPDTDADYVDGK